MVPNVMTIECNQSRETEETFPQPVINFVCNAGEDMNFRSSSTNLSFLAQELRDISEAAQLVQPFCSYVFFMALPQCYFYGCKTSIGQDMTRILFSTLHLFKQAINANCMSGSLLVKVRTESACTSV